MKHCGWFLNTIFVGALLTALPQTQNIHAQETAETLHSLARKFNAPSDEYRPFVWWHWMGSNFSKYGITKDLEAMKNAGIGGATIFNLASAVQETHAPTKNNPWPHQTYRSPEYWDALRFTAAEAKRLGLKLGIQNSPGYATSGGPWISEEQGMQTLVSNRKKITGNQWINARIEKPELPVYGGYGTTRKRATFYKDVAVMAVPVKADVSASEILDISDRMDASGTLNWQAPEGEWTIYRIGHAPTMANPHPLPDDIIGKTLEVDKMSREANTYYWQEMIDPLLVHLKEYIGNTFTFVHIDSYEAGSQHWTPSFRNEFIRRKGYDPLPWIALRYSIGKRSDIDLFNADYRFVINRLFIDNGWAVARDMIHKAGLQLYWEPYSGQFDQYESVSLSDVPMDEFWTGGSGKIGQTTFSAAKYYGKRIVAAEAFTGRPEISKYTEDPAFLKRSADGSFVSGVNWMFLHHWVHQPFDDKYQPGMGMGWWGTHFGRHQTWIKPGKAFFTYLARCQMLLQQGTYVNSKEGIIHRKTPEADIFFVINQDTKIKKTYAFPVKGRTPELWDAYSGTIHQTTHWRTQSDLTHIDLNLAPNQSMFVIFPHRKSTYNILPEIEVLTETPLPITGEWNILFEPKLEKPFTKVFPALVDFGKQDDAALKYFSGTAKYEKSINIVPETLDKNKRIVLDLGELHDIAELEINGQNAGVLWSPPYKINITPHLKSGENKIAVYITTNWANRLIGDEQHPPDFQWGTDRGEERGRAMKAYPDWFINNQPRPSQGRKTFNIWYYFRKNSPLQPAGLIGPVRILQQTLK
ncbi:MAG: hypothetical protein LBS59_05345 [Puniceicoccales bacterium]|jgi:hypothetical protein|nr:hypothetical protein [Puniceicoccales bacterium]